MASMATLQSYNLTSSTRIKVLANLHHPSDPKTHQISLPNLSMLEELSLKQHQPPTHPSLNLPKLLAIVESAADRAQMHTIIGAQRNNWALLLPTSINSLTLAASIMAGIAPISPTLKLSSTLLFATATGMMLLTNKIQPCQLAEEQRNASRLFRQLEKSIQTSLALGTPTTVIAEEAMKRILALDRTYPLPLLPGMLEKFPATVEPTVWWPRRSRQNPDKKSDETNNGWSSQLEEEMKGVLRVLKKKDTDEYLRVGRLVLSINKVFAFLGPLLAGLATIGAGLIGDPVIGTLALFVAVVGGTASAVVNSLEHSGQLGMVFELLRNCAGHYRRLEEEIEFNLGEEVGMRENGEMFELKMALHLGRSIEEMKEFSSCRDDADVKEFAGKLF